MTTGHGPADRQQVTRLLVDWANGNKQALDALTPIVYRELHQLAESYLRRERAAATLQPTALIHEAYLRLVSQDLPDWQSRSHFFGVAAQLMRQILVDHARKHRSQKRGGGLARVTLDKALGFAPEQRSDVIALDDALNALASFDERKARVIEMRFFGGLSVEETGQALGISVATVGREQRLAEAWLHREMKQGELVYLMTRERWQQVEGLFHQAAEMQPAQRTAWLAEVCGSDLELLHEVTALLASDQSVAGGFVEGQVEGAVLDFHSSPPKASVRRAGPYRLVKEIGRGGMGTVYLGERDDDQYQGQVAVKIVRPGMDTDFFLTRFRRERQTLARLVHPNIARLLDSGTTDDGLPFIVMELIEGSPIHQFCRDRNLTIEQRVRLFLSVCAAVSHAHRNFVVHRDIKPGNIMVDQAGTAKLLDFGICKLLFGGAAQGETVGEGMRMMTPDYACPEQVRGDPITVASDLYSLGAVLYELITGARAHLIDRYTPQAVERAICHVDVLPPSTAAPHTAKRQLEGDLDTILLKTLRKAPAERYDSVDEFAADLRRHLDHQPVIARPDTLIYRVRKFARRHRTALAAGSAVFLILCAATAVSSYEALQARRNFEAIRQLSNSLIFEVHDQVRDLPGSMKARQTIVRMGIQYLDSLAGRAGGDAGLREQLAGAYLRMGEIQGNLQGSNTGDLPGAAASLSKALRLAESLPETPKAAVTRLEVLRRMADLQTDTATPTEAMATLAKAQAFGEGALARFPANDDLRDEVGEIHASLARLQRQRGDVTGSMSSAVKALEIARATVAAHPGDFARRALLPSRLTAVGMVQSSSRQLDAALGNFQEAIAIWDDICRGAPGNARYQRERMIAYSHLGDVLGNPAQNNLGDPKKAIQAFGTMLDIARKLHESNSGDMGATRDFGMALMRVAAIPAASEQHRIAMFRQSNDLLSEVAARTPSNADLRVNIASVEEQLGDLLIASGDLDGARRAWTRAASEANAVAGSALAASRRIAITSYGKLGADAARQGDRGKALKYSESALAVAESLKREKSLTMVQRTLPPRAYAAAGTIHELVGDRTEARQWRERALAAWRELENLPGFTEAHRTEMNRLSAALESRKP